MLAIIKEDCSFGEPVLIRDNVFRGREQNVVVALQNRAKDVALVLLSSMYFAFVSPRVCELVCLLSNQRENISSFRKDSS